MANPSSLPSNFFEQQQQNPNTLPANSFDSGSPDFLSATAVGENGVPIRQDQLANFQRNQNPTQFEQEQAQRSSKLKRIGKALTGTIPAITGTVGAIAGAPAFGAGGVVGGALGAAGGEQIRQNINRLALGDTEPSPISRQGLKQTAIAGALGGVAEVPGAILSTAGSMLLPKIAAAKSEAQVGDALAGLKAADPAGISQRAILADVQSAAAQDAAKLRTSLANTNGAIDIDSVIAGARSRAIDANTRLKGTLQQFDKLVETARINAGIPASTPRNVTTGNPGTQAFATPQQLFDFQQQLQKAFSGATGNPAPLLKNNLQKILYRDAGEKIRDLVPESDALLKRLTNFHAAEDALTSYGLSRVGALAVTAAQNPVKTALLSPIAAAATPLVFDRAKRTVGGLVNQIAK